MTMQNTRNATDTDIFQTLIAVLFSGSIARKMQAAQILTEIGVPRITALTESSGDADPMVRKRALIALGALFQPEANLSTLSRPGNNQDTGSASPPATAFFSNGQRSRVVHLLIEKMQHDADEECRIMAAASLMKIGDLSGVKEVRRQCLQQGRDFEGQILDVVWGTSDAPRNEMPHVLRPPMPDRRARQGAWRGRRR